MITSEALAELIGFEATHHRVLSVVLGLAPERQIQRDYLIVLKNLVRDLAATLDEASRVALAEEAGRVTAYLEATPPRGLGIVIYSCSPLGLWRVFYLPEAPADAAYFTPNPRLRPVLDQLDEHERYAAIVVDRDSARVLVVAQRDIEEWWQLESVIPGRHKQGGWSQANFQRSHDKAVDDHLALVCDHVIEMDRELPVDRIAIGGPPEASARLQTLLPAPLRDRLIGTFAIEMTATDTELLERTAALALQAEREGEVAIVELVINDSAAGGLATTGLEAVLLAVGNAQVGTLVVVGDLDASGGVCPACGRLTAGSAEVCPGCGAVLDPVDDVVESAIERTLVAGGGVELVHGAAAERLGTEAGGIGALLRYVTNAAGPES